MLWTDVDMSIDETREHVHAREIEFFIARKSFRAEFIGSRNLVGEGKARESDIDDLRDAILFDDDVDGANGRRTSPIDQGRTAQNQMRKRAFAFGARRSLRHDIVVCLGFDLVSLRKRSR